MNLIVCVFGENFQNYAIPQPAINDIRRSKCIVVAGFSVSARKRLLSLFSICRSVFTVHAVYFPAYLLTFLIKRFVCGHPGGAFPVQLKIAFAGMLTVEVVALGKEMVLIQLVNIVVFGMSLAADNGVKKKFH